YPGTAETAFDCTARLPPGISAGPPQSENGTLRFPLAVAADARMTSPYPPGFEVLGGNSPAGALVSAQVGGRAVRLAVDLEQPLAVGPAQSLRVDPDAIVQPIASLPARHEVAVALEGPPKPISVDLPPGASATIAPAGISLQLEATLVPGRHRLAIR